jgi:hypothetical protein
MLNIKSWNYVIAFVAAVFILSSGVSTVYAAPDSLPTLKLVQSVVIDDGGSAVADDWNLFAFNGETEIIFNQGGSGIFETVDAGMEITLSQSEFPLGYESGLWSCDNGVIPPLAPLILSLGDRVTCTITSNDIAPTLQLVKVVIDTNGGGAVPDDWTLSATGSGSDAKRNFSNTGGSGVPKIIFADAIYNLAETGDNLSYTAQNDGKWDCIVTHANDGVINFLGVRGISLSEGDSAICTITNVEDLPSVSLEVPSKIHGKLTVSSEVKGFENKVPVSFKVYKMDGTVKSMVYEGFVSAAPYNFSVPAKILEAGSSYEITANASDSKGKDASKSVIVNIPAKGNK